MTARSPWSQLAMFFLAGVILTSLVAMTFRDRPGNPSNDGAAADSLPSGAAKAPDPAPARGAGFSPQGELPLDLLAEIQRLLAGPDHALTSLRLHALLDSIPTARIPDLIRLANTESDPQTRAAFHEPLLERWLAEDPDAALDFALSERIGSQVDPVNGTNLANNLFSNWMRRDRPDARAWLLDHWDHEVLGEDAFLGSLRQFLAIGLMDNLLRTDGVDAAFTFADELRDHTDRRAVLAGLMDSPWHSYLNTTPQGNRMALHQAVKDLDDASTRHELVRSLWLTWSEQHPDWVQEIAPDLPPADRFDLALAWMGTNARWSESIPNGDGSFTQNNLGVHDRKAREEVEASGYSGDELPPMVAIQWASRISDPALREQMCRGAYLRLIQRDQAAAQAYLQRPNAPQDLLPVFQSILVQSP